MAKIVGLKDLKVFQNAYSASMEIFTISKTFPKEEQYSLTSQIRRSSRSVSANISEAWRKRRYFAKHFVSKLSDADAEAAETQVWLMYSRDCGYMTDKAFDALYGKYDWICSQLTLMMEKPGQWCRRREESAKNRREKREERREKRERRDEEGIEKRKGGR